MVKRLFDILFSFMGLVILLPFFIVIGLIIIVDSGMPVFYLQERIGKNRKPFKLIKFRSMRNSASGMQITVDKDSRITRSGGFLRKFKLDELPQLINILIGDMSFVGPRPEVKKYVDHYSEEQLKVLTVKPGLTGLDSLEFSNESELLDGRENPEEIYINEIMPKKLSLSLDYINRHSMSLDFNIMIKTAKKIFF